MRRMQNSIIQYRATILKQQFDRDGRFPSGVESTVTLKIKGASPVECSIGDIDCKVLRTIEQLPRPIRKNRTPIPFSFVGTMNQELAFTFVEPEEVRSFLEGNKFINQSRLYAYINDYVYTFNHDGGNITIRDPFADPRQLNDLLDCDQKPCEPNLHLDMDMIRVIKQMIFEEIGQLKFIPEDKNIKINE